MPDVPVPVPAEAAAAVPDLYQNYDPTGAMGGLFAPALIRGWQPSEDAVTAWTKLNRSMTPQGIEDTRMPFPAMADRGSAPSDQYGGGAIPLNLNYAGQGGVDPEALRVWSQGGKYDWDARRNLISRRLMGQV
jgi:hypothetical protein